MAVENRRVLAVMPHPDDIEILCAGTLLKLRAAGFELHLATLTPGDKGSAERTSEEIAAIRRQEAAAAAQALGAASYQCLEFRDLEIDLTVPSRRRVATLLRAIAPLVVFTTPPADYMMDHEVTSCLVRDACFNAGVPLYDTGTTAPALEGVPYLYYSDAVEGHDILGNESKITCLVDVSAEMEQKVAALICHDSQRSWLRRQHGMDNYVESMKQWSARRGALCGVQYAEAFCQHVGHPHPQDDWLCRMVNGVSRESHGC